MIGIEEAVHVDDEVAHHGVVDGAVRSALPGGKRLRVVGVDADDIEVLEIAELDALERGELASEYEMQQLLRWLLVSAH